MGDIPLELHTCMAQITEKWESRKIIRMTYINSTLNANNKTLKRQAIVTEEKQPYENALIMRYFTVGFAFSFNYKTARPFTA
jgi:hypothetical protein